ncbi:hypothetical protein EDB19DRAFT_1702115 [Suillus lakei]|nr:hypothetical protein EDB19DRAFT_1702115 [Suillus lakei]
MAHLIPALLAVSRLRAVHRRCFSADLDMAEHPCVILTCSQHTLSGPAMQAAFESAGFVYGFRFSGVPPGGSFDDSPQYYLCAIAAAM